LKIRCPRTDTGEKVIDGTLVHPVAVVDDRERLSGLVENEMNEWRKPYIFLTSAMDRIEGVEDGFA
jgi:hypothetical protein